MTITSAHTNEFGIRKMVNIVAHWKDAYQNVQRDPYMLIFTQDQKFCIYINHILHEVPAYSVLFIPQGVNTCFVEEELADPYILYFTSLFYERSTNDAEFLRNSTLFDTLDKAFIFQIPDIAKNYTNLMLNIIFDAENNPSNQNFKDLAHNIIEQILMLATVYGKHEVKAVHYENIDHMLMSNFKKLLEAHFTEQKTVKFYADRLNITTRRLGKACMMGLGKSPKEVILDYLIREAKRKLIYTELSIKEIAYELGYYDENNFSALFSKEVLLSPKAFRKQHISEMVH